MTEFDFKHEYLFILGNGASIASAQPELDNFFTNKLSIEKFIDALDEINQKKDLSQCRKYLGDCIKDYSYSLNVQRIIEISEEKGRKEEKEKKRETNISKLFDSLFEDEDRNEDINKLISVIFMTIISYYKNCDDKYFMKLWEIVSETKSSVISLN